ncbi:ScbR family autoregulator-binding transcription factor [Streptomyces sp. 21So2-11]|uniref:ScbR family autoregulator-binding transcription factor n=1 Tax=Streptomyces sp. 21So2-11 TaxID=3144408 RepID=UPI00321BB739
MSKQERAVRTRKLLIASAARAFYEHGYTRTSLTTVSSRVGVSSGALYFHFENKAALATAVEAEASSALRAVTRRACRSRNSSLQALIDTTHGLAELLRTSIVAKAGFQLNSGDFEGPRVNLRDEWWECVQRLLSGASREHALDPGLPRRAIASSIVAATVGFEVLSRSDQEWLSRESVTGFWQLQLPCLTAPGVAGRLDPSGTGPSGTGPAGTGPAGIGPVGTGPATVPGRAASRPDPAPIAGS